MYKDELRIKDVVIRNRIAIPPMVCFHWSDDSGMVTDKNINHYEELSEGGAGLVIVEATAITRRGRLHRTELGIWDDSQIEGLSKITEAIHRHGAKAFIQLVHAGGNADDPNPEAPSAIKYWKPGIPEEMSKERIKATCEDFARAAVRAKKAGFDGVELHGCHSYLISCFLSTLKNLRDDEYGKDRTLFPIEVLKAVREAVGPDYVVGIRIAAFEPTLKEGLENCIKIAPYADFYDVSYGADCKGYAPEGFTLSEAVYGASVIKKELPNMPVFGVHNINSKEDVIAALETGIDMVDVGKASLVDPGFAGHIINDEPYGQCLHCNNYCRWNPGEMANPDLKCPGFMKFHKN